MNLRMQLLCGSYKQAPKLIRDNPSLRSRWTYEQLDQMVTILGVMDLEGMDKKKLAAYLYIRGDEGDLCRCEEYGTGEYCVLLRLLREQERKLGQEEAKKIVQMHIDGATGEYETEFATFAQIRREAIRRGNQN